MDSASLKPEFDAQMQQFSPNKKIGECSPKELQSPFNLYLYAATVLKSKLPPEQHSLMEKFLRESPDEHVRGYFDFLSKRTLWGRIKRIFGV